MEVKEIKKLINKWYIAIPLIIILTPLLVLLINPNASPYNAGKLVWWLVMGFLLLKFIKWQKRKREEDKKIVWRDI